MIYSFDFGVGEFLLIEDYLWFMYEHDKNPAAVGCIFTQGVHWFWFAESTRPVLVKWLCTLMIVALVESHNLPEFSPSSAIMRQHGSSHVAVLSHEFCRFPEDPQLCYKFLGPELPRRRPSTWVASSANTCGAWWQMAGRTSGGRRHDPPKVRYRRRKKYCTSW